VNLNARGFYTLAILLFSAISISRVEAQSSELLDSFDEVLAAVSEIRHLEPKVSIKRGVKTKEEVRSYLVERVEKEYPPEVIMGEEQFLKMLNLIPEDMDYYQFMLDLLTEQVAGYYDPYTDQFFLADWIPVEIQKPVIAHELMHALQDQYFDLESYLKRIPEDDDRMLARSALVEGEGFAIMLAYSLKPLGQDLTDIPNIVQLNQAQMPLMEAQFPIFAKAPRFLKELLMFPYTYGASFLQWFLRNHSWEEVSLLYDNVPESSEQILHPEKYASEPDPPQKIDLKDFKESSGIQGEPIYTNVLGEYVIYLLVGEFLDSDQAAAASQGWGGDSIELLTQSDGRRTLVLDSVWDSEKDATEFFDAYRSIASKRGASSTNPAVGTSDSASFWKFLNEHREIQLEKKGIRVTLIERER
jgi:hypothetical protein